MITQPERPLVSYDHTSQPHRDQDIDFSPGHSASTEKEGFLSVRCDSAALERAVEKESWRWRSGLRGMKR